MRLPELRRGAAIAVVALLLDHVAACVPNAQKRELASRPQSLSFDGPSKFLKAHMRNGEAIILSPFAIDTSARVIRGTGVRYDINRVATDSGQLTVPMDSAVLYESNDVNPGEIAALTVVSGASIALTTYCMANPKACFGSCPTFYVETESGWRLEGEGFSSSVAPSLEATDVDALPHARARNGVVNIQVKNEAYETHNIRSARLLAVPYPKGEEVYADEHGQFWRSRVQRSVTSCSSGTGSCTREVRSIGDGERFTLTDSTDLAAREYITVRFAELAAGRAGLVIKARQSLVSTYLFYQALAWMGKSTGSWLAALERGDPLVKRQATDPAAALGGIEIQLRDSTGNWMTVAETLEHGPIVSDLRVLPLPAGYSTTEVRIRLAKGAWRIDYLALASIDERVTPDVIEPERVTRNGRDDADARARLLDSTRLLTTLPGDSYALSYRLPRGNEPVKLFLAARGYYLEWMRDAWIAEENPAKAAMLLMNPALAMRTIAPEFKRVESEMEGIFWRSRYVPR